MGWIGPAVPFRAAQLPVPHPSTPAAMDAKPMNALSNLIEGNPQAAVNLMEAFENNVEAQRGKKRTDAEAGGLLAIADDIIAAIGGGVSPATPVFALSGENVSELAQVVELEVLPGEDVPGSTTGTGDSTGRPWLEPPELCHAGRKRGREFHLQHLLGRPGYAGDCRESARTVDGASDCHFALLARATHSPTILQAPE